MISILAHKLTPEQVAELGGEPKHIRDIDPVLAEVWIDVPGGPSRFHGAANVRDGKTTGALAQKAA